MEPNTLKAMPRTCLGTRHARRERDAGLVPAILYGHKETPQAVSLSAHDLAVQLAHGSRVLTLEMDGKEGQYLIKEVQHDYRHPVPIHIDLMRVAKNERVTVDVPIELRGTPKGVSEGGMLEQMLNEVEVECLVTQIPESFRPLVTELEVGASLTVADLEVPAGVVVKAAPDERIAMVRVLAEELVAEEVEGEESPAQPEVISRAKGEEGDEAPE